MMSLNAVWSERILTHKKETTYHYFRIKWVSNGNMLKSNTFGTSDPIFTCGFLDDLKANLMICRLAKIRTNINICEIEKLEKAQKKKYVLIT